MSDGNEANHGPGTDEFREVVQRGLWFEEFETGVRYLHRPGRTITEADNVLFTTLTMNTQALHLDAAFSDALPPFNQRLVNSMFTLSTLVGLSVDASSNQAHAALCSPDSPATVHGAATGCHTLNFAGGDGGTVSSDWDLNYYKAECAPTEFVAGVAQNPSGALTDILCCTGQVTHQACAALITSVCPATLGAVYPTLRVPSLLIAEPLITA